MVARDEAREVLAFEMLPEAFDRIEIRAVGRKVERRDVVPVESGDLVPSVLSRGGPGARSQGLDWI